MILLRKGTTNGNFIAFADENGVKRRSPFVVMNPLNLTIGHVEKGAQGFGIVAEEKGDSSISASNGRREFVLFVVALDNAWLFLVLFGGEIRERIRELQNSVGYVYLLPPTQCSLSIGSSLGIVGIDGTVPVAGIFAVRFVLIIGTLRNLSAAVCLISIASLKVVT